MNFIFNVIYDIEIFAKFLKGKDKIDLDYDTISTKDDITKIEFNVVASKSQSYKLKRRIIFVCL